MGRSHQSPDGVTVSVYKMLQNMYPVQFCCVLFWLLRHAWLAVGSSDARSCSRTAATRRGGVLCSAAA
jgi:hypothetical protein